MSIVLTILAAVAGASYFAYTLGKAAAYRKPSLNHHRMMMLLVDLRTHDDAVPIIPEWMRGKMARLLDEYERLDLGDDDG